MDGMRWDGYGLVRIRKQSRKVRARVFSLNDSLIGFDFATGISSFCHTHYYKTKKTFEPTCLFVQQIILRYYKINSTAYLLIIEMPYLELGNFRILQ